ncbi:MAG: glycosyltransferase family 39 protein [Xanthobacteraceae bacterium]
MFYVPLYIEALRSRPGLVFWLATLAQAVLWLMVPLLFYAAPPSELARLLAVGHEFPFTADFGPPLAYWLAEIAFRAAGLLGVYALSQICVIATYWCVFTLGREIVGPTHAAMAVLLMVGILVFTVPTPNFGPPILAMALWAAVLLFYWQAAIEGRRRSWYPLGGATALLLLTSDAALILLGTVAAFTALSVRGRAALRPIEAWIVLAGLTVVLGVHLFWLKGAGDVLATTLARLRIAGVAGENTAAWLRLAGALVLAHAGLAILVVLASGWPRTYADPAPAIARAPVVPSAITFVKVFALIPALLATAITVLLGQRLPIGGAAPLLVLSGLAVVVAAGEAIALHHQRTLGFAWAGLLVVPAILVPAAIVLLPWTIGTDLAIAQPAAAMGRFFADSFERRTGHPLAIVSGDTRIAALVALAAPSRPEVYFAAEPERSPWVTAQDLREKGAVVVWPAAPTTPEPPPAIKARFPDLIAEVPQTFARPVRGRLPPLRIGWGMIRPASAPAAATPTAPAVPASPR